MSSALSTARSSAASWPLAIGSTSAAVRGRATAAAYSRAYSGPTSAVALREARGNRRLAGALGADQADAVERIERFQSTIPLMHEDAEDGVEAGGQPVARFEIDRHVRDVDDQPEPPVLEQLLVHHPLADEAERGVDGSRKVCWESCVQRRSCMTAAVRTTEAMAQPTTASASFAARAARSCSRRRAATRTSRRSRGRSRRPAAPRWRRASPCS